MNPKQQQAFQNPALPDSGNKRKDRKKDEIVWPVISGKSDEEISACFLALRDLGIIGIKAEKLSHLPFGSHLHLWVDAGDDYEFKG